MTNFEKYTRLAMSGNLNEQMKYLSEFELFVHRDDASDETIQLVLYGQFGISAPSKDALFALDAIESRHDVLPSHTLSIPGGDLHIYTKPDDIEITPYNGQVLNWLSADLSIHDSSQSVELPSCPRLLKLVPEWEACNPTQAFIDDIHAFNEGQLVITIHNEITRREIQPSRRLGDDDMVPKFSAEGMQQRILRPQAASA